MSDSESYESQRSKLLLVVEVESVLPRRLARTVLEGLARTELYVITVRAAGLCL